MSTSGMAGHSNVSRILCRTCLCPQLQPLPSKASLHDLPWNTLRMARSRCSRMFLTVTLPLAARSAVSWNSCRRLAFSKAKQWVSAGCSSQVRRAGTYTTQILHRTQLARNLGPRCALQASNSRMGCLSGQCCCKTLLQCRAIPASSASLTHALFRRKMCTFGDKLLSRRNSPSALVCSTCSLPRMYCGRRGWMLESLHNKATSDSTLRVCAVVTLLVTRPRRAARATSSLAKTPLAGS